MYNEKVDYNTFNVFFFLAVKCTFFIPIFLIQKLKIILKLKIQVNHKVLDVIQEIKV